MRALSSTKIWILVLCVVTSCDSTGPPVGSTLDSDSPDSTINNDTTGVDSENPDVGADTLAQSFNDYFPIAVGNRWDYRHESWRNEEIFLVNRKAGTARVELTTIVDSLDAGGCLIARNYIFRESYSGLEYRWDLVHDANGRHTRVPMDTLDVVWEHAAIVRERNDSLIVLDSYRDSPLKYLLTDSYTRWKQSDDETIIESFGGPNSGGARYAKRDLGIFSRSSSDMTSNAGASAYGWYMASDSLSDMSLSKIAGCG